MKSRKLFMSAVAAAALATSAVAFASPVAAGPVVCKLSRKHADNWLNIYFSLPAVYNSFAWVEFGRAETVSNRVCR